MARGHFSPVSPAPLPKVSFVKVQDDGSTKPAGVHDGQARSYGYNDFSDFNRPEHYIRHIEPLESELAVQVEYDMDEQDQEWLDAVNQERKKEQLNGVTYETFEIVMDRLEKEWFDLTKNIPKPDMAMPSEDSTCAICDDSEGENSNAIVFCDGCNLAVHQDCYGVPYIPEGQWLCRKCTVSPENPVSCVLCPNEGGAFKQTILGEWVHLLCAIWVPETRVANEVFMEPITGLEKVSKQRWKLKCSLCGIREGACVQCAKTSCFLAFHATCARKEKFLMPMKSTQGAEAVALTCYCEKHLPKEQLDLRLAALEAEGLDSNSRNPRLSKSARAYAKTYKPGPPLVPNIIVERLMQYIAKIMVRKKPEFILMVCKYWSLKREARRGAPLLKRLHLEPWTASSGGKMQSDEEKAMKLEQLRRLRNDLGSVRDLADLTKKREEYKRDQLEAIQDVLSKSLFPHEPVLRMTFEKIITGDRNDYFKNPVSKAEVPDYHDIVKRPMCWNTIDSKLDRHEYWDLQAFKDDVQLVLSNAILYNKAGSPFYRTAQRLQTASEALFADVQEQLRLSGVWHKSETAEAADDNTMVDSLKLPSQIGSLEPSLTVLDLLIAEGVIDGDIDLIMKTDPLTSLFNYEFGEFKPPPPPTPPPPPKPKRDRKADRARAKQAKESAKESQAQLQLDTSPGFRAPRTRHGIAAAAAFEAEAEGGGDVEEHEHEFDSPEEHARREAAKQKPARKRSSAALPRYTDVPPIVDEVDNRQSFKMFNDGWILPENAKRGNRSAAERAPPPLPKKKYKKNRDVSGLSALSSSTADNQTLQLLADAAAAESRVLGQGSATHAMEVDIPPAQDSNVSSPLSDVNSEPEAATSSVKPMSSIKPMSSVQPMSTVKPLSSVKPLSGVKPMPTVEPLSSVKPMSTDQPMSTVEPMLSVKPASTVKPVSTVKPMSTMSNVVEPTIIRTADGKIIVETLDTPAMRKQKSIMRRAERERLASISAQAGPSTFPVVDLEPSISHVSEGQDDPQGRSVSRTAASAPPRDPAVVVLEDGRTLDGGTLVWAKAQSYPWWPAVIFEPDDITVSPNIRESRAHVRRTGSGALHLVRFFDQKNSWQWVELNQLLLMFENTDLDIELLASNSKKQKWKKPSVRDNCRAAFRRAEAERQLDGEEDLFDTPEVEAVPAAVDGGAAEPPEAPVI
ncbi:hypothetical protein FIBSPDRAFT_1046754 [Athelia psychrophila]|uniref:Bromodomain-containing protein n=1 Tax=Athelia psychrophila TaxID=1759441 RepID=A0A166G8Q3_9AGAM|nr:hypothetical protein FIBSPDRAFT_1046754 [Fibularhizoctonia sp. CBS 109695]